MQYLLCTCTCAEKLLMETKADIKHCYEITTCVHVHTSAKYTVCTSSYCISLSRSLSFSLFHLVHFQGRSCPKCGRPNHNHSPECYKCGHQLPSTATKWVYVGSHSGRGRRLSVCTCTLYIYMYVYMHTVCTFCTLCPALAYKAQDSTTSSLNSSKFMCLVSGMRSSCYFLSPLPCCLFALLIPSVHSCVSTCMYM